MLDGNVVLGTDVLIDTDSDVDNDVTITGTVTDSGGDFTLTVNTGQGGGQVDLQDTVTTGGLIVQNAGTVNLAAVSTDTTGGIVIGSANPVTEINLSGDLDSTNGDAAANAGPITLDSDDIKLLATVTIDANDDSGADGVITLGDIDADVAGVQGLNLRIGNATGNDLVAGEFGSDTSLGMIDVDAVADSTLKIAGNIGTRNANVDFGGAAGANVDVTGNGGSQFIIDTSDAATGNAGAIKLDGLTLISGGIDLDFRADHHDGTGQDGDVTLPSTITAASVEVDGRQLAIGNITTTDGGIRLNADASDDDPTGVDIAFTGAQLDTTNGSAVAADSLTLESGGSDDTMQLDNSGNLVTFQTAGAGNEDAGIVIGLLLDAAANEPLTLLADDGGGDGDGDVGITAAVGSKGTIGLLTIGADQVTLDANVDSAGLQVTAQNTTATSVSISDGVTVDVNNVSSFINAGGLIDAGGEAAITSSGGDAAFLIRPLASTSPFGVGDGVTSGARVSNAFLQAFDGTMSVIEIGYDQSQSDTPGVDQSGKITIDTAGGVTVASPLTIQADGATVELDTGDITLTSAGDALTLNGANAIVPGAADSTLVINTSHTSGGASPDNDGGNIGFGQITSNASNSYLDSVEIGMSTNGTDGDALPGTLTVADGLIEVDGTTGTVVEVVGAVSIDTTNGLTIEANPADATQNTGQIDLDRAVLDGGGAVVINSGNANTQAAGDVLLGDVGANSAVNSLAVDTQGVTTAGTLYLNDSDGNSTTQVSVTTGDVDLRTDFVVTLDARSDAVGGEISFGPVGNAGLGGQYLAGFTAQTNGPAGTTSRINLDHDITVDDAAENGTGLTPEILTYP